MRQNQDCVFLSQQHHCEIVTLTTKICARKTIPIDRHQNITKQKILWNAEIWIQLQPKNEEFQGESKEPILAFQIVHVQILN